MKQILGILFITFSLLMYAQQEESITFNVPRYQIGPYLHTGIALPTYYYDAPMIEAGVRFIFPQKSHRFYIETYLQYSKEMYHILHLSGASYKGILTDDVALGVIFNPSLVTQPKYRLSLTPGVRIGSTIARHYIYKNKSYVSGEIEYTEYLSEFEDKSNSTSLNINIGISFGFRNEFIISPNLSLFVDLKATAIAGFPSVFPQSWKFIEQKQTFTGGIGLAYNFFYKK